MPRKHNPGCPCCPKTPPCPPCATHDCYESYGNFSSVRVEVTFDQDDWNYYERIRTFSCSGDCTHKYRDREIYREMSGFLQFNGTYDIGFYTYNSIDGAVASTPAEEPCGYWFFPKVLGEMYRRTETTTTTEYACGADSTIESITTPTMQLWTHMGLVGFSDSVHNLSTFPGAAQVNFGIPIVWGDYTSFQGNTLFPCEPAYGAEEYAETSVPIEERAFRVPADLSNSEQQMTGFWAPPQCGLIETTIGGVAGFLVNATCRCIRNWGQTRTGLNAYSTSQSFAPNVCSDYRRPAEYVLNWSALSWKIKVSLNV